MVTSNYQFLDWVSARVLAGYKCQRNARQTTAQRFAEDP